MNKTQKSNKVHRLVFIINPNSGLTSKQSVKDKIIQYFDKKGIATTVKLTKKAGDAYDYAKKYSLQKNIKAIIAVGGDGTVNEVVNGIGETGKPMGIIRGGSGNGLARHLGIPIILNKALAMIEKAEICSIDLMKINGQYSANVSGVGFDAMVAHKFQNVNTRGPVSYVRIILTEFATFKAQSYSITVDGKQIERDAYLISFANSSQFGNNALISPTASVTDGYIDLCIVKPFPKISSPIIVERLMTGRLDDGKYVEIVKAKSITLKQKSSIYHIDGEAREGANKLEIDIVPSVLNMIIPKNKIKNI
jgi:YegS/Rv2252/BmrU family lipid kinase